MGSLSRREKDRLFALFIRSLIVIIVLAMMGGLILFFKDKNQSVETTSATGDNMISDTETESPQSYIKDVSNSTLDRLNDGTILSFGDLNSTTEISVIADPSDLDSEGLLVPELVEAVESGSVRLNIYPVAQEESHQTGTNSLVRVATCFIGSDENEQNTTTLNSIIKAGKSFGGQEDLVVMSELMGVSTDIECPETAVNSVVFTENNAQHFMTHFGMDESGAVITNRGAVTDISVLSDNWVEVALDKGSIEDMVSS